jgi:hypothetical protein
MRTFTISTETDLEALRRSLIDRRISATRAEAAIARIRALNPHVDLDRARPGTVIFVPDGPEFTTRAGATPTGIAAGELQSLAAAALGAAAEALKTGLAERAGERRTAREALESAVFRRAIANDQDLQRRAEAAFAAIEEDEAAEGRAAEELDASARAALDALSELGKLAG